ncbi:hypothetical protein [Nostoc sp.]|uniref:hypothetical protein n=1 Tax=Nostoc sp. TaxID=1180 RepID=UPI002FFBAEF4
MIFTTYFKLLADPHELQFLQKVDCYNNIYWQADDPATGKSFSSVSQADVDMWIEHTPRTNRDKLDKI